MLRSVGHEVTIVDNGEQALDALENRIVRPGPDGPQHAGDGGLDAIKLHRFAASGERMPPLRRPDRRCHRRDQAAVRRGRHRRLCHQAGRGARAAEPGRPAHSVRAGAGAGPPTSAGSAVVVPHPRWRAAAGTRPRLSRAAAAAGRPGRLRCQRHQDFIEDAEHLMREIEVAAAAADADAFRDCAHALRSSAAHIGATAIFELCLAWRGISRTSWPSTARATRRGSKQLRAAARRASRRPRRAGPPAAGAQPTALSGLPPRSVAAARAPSGAAARAPDAPSAAGRPRRAERGLDPQAGDRDQLLVAHRLAMLTHPAERAQRVVAAAVALEIVAHRIGPSPGSTTRSTRPISSSSSAV